MSPGRGAFPSRVGRTTIYICEPNEPSASDQVHDSVLPRHAGKPEQHGVHPVHGGLVEVRRSESVRRLRWPSVFTRRIQTHQHFRSWYFNFYGAGEILDHKTNDILAFTFCACRTRHSLLVSRSLVPPADSLHAAAGGIVITSPVVGPFWPKVEPDSKSCERSAI